MPLVEGAAGHGCGHNLFGAASLGAAVAIKEQIEAGRLKGTVVFFGTPAEEDVGGKTYMVREGLFDNVDAVLAWHPSDETQADMTSSQAMVDLAVEFRGKSAHAAYDPWNARSAVDALELFTHGVNLMREHIRPSSRMHYVIVAGATCRTSWPSTRRPGCGCATGSAARSTSCWRERASSPKAQPAMTETSATVTVQGGNWEMLVNETGARLLHANLLWLGRPSTPSRSRPSRSRCSARRACPNTACSRASSRSKASRLRAARPTSPT
jgi:aminobenzoyl-glutamate utilization protein B